MLSHYEGASQYTLYRADCYFNTLWSKPTQYCSMYCLSTRNMPRTIPVSEKHVYKTQVMAAWLLQAKLSTPSQRDVLNTSVPASRNTPSPTVACMFLIRSSTIGQLQSACGSTQSGLFGRWYGFRVNHLFFVSLSPSHDSSPHYSLSLTIWT